MSSYIAKDVRCPYYKREEGVKISCEGVEDNTIIQLVHRSNKGRLEYQRFFCCEHYNTCPIAIMLNMVQEEEI